MKPEDFSKMRHNPFDCKPGQRIWQRYPELKRYDSLCTVPTMTSETNINVIQVDEDDVDLMVKFVILLVERHDSPIGEIRDLDYKRDMAMQALGIKKHATGIWYYLNLGHRWYHEVLFDYFRLTNDDHFELWFSMKMSYKVNMKILRREFDTSSDDRDIKIVQQIKASAPADLKNLQEIEAKLFSDDRIREIITKEAMATDRDAEKYAQEEFVHRLN